MRLPGVALGSSADEAPNVGIKAAELALHSEKRFGIINGCGNFQAVANNSRIAKQSLHFSQIVTRHDGRIELIEYLAIAGALLEHSIPTQPGLRTFQNEQLKKAPVVMHRHAPFLIMIRNI